MAVIEQRSEQLSSAVCDRFSPTVRATSRLALTSTPCGNVPPDSSQIFLNKGKNKGKTRLKQSSVLASASYTTQTRVAYREGKKEVNIDLIRQSSHKRR